MKTLDEVIDAMECCSIPHYFDCKGCPYEDDDAEVGCRSDDRDADALHYLKEYKAYRDRLTSDTAQTIICPRCHSEMGIFLPEGNEPLTWDELRQMEGKPVWVEESAENGLWWTYWVIWQDENAVLPKEKYGTEWQAYRKERPE